MRALIFLLIVVHKNNQNNGIKLQILLNMYSTLGVISILQDLMVF